MKICLRPRQRGLLTMQHALETWKIINASWRCILKSLEKLRPTLGNISVETYLSKSLVKLSISFADLFALIKIKLESEPHGLFDWFVVFRSDVHQLITRVRSGGLSINRCPNQRLSRLRSILFENNPDCVWCRHCRGYIYIIWKAKHRGP